MSDQPLVFNGINGATGQYLLAPRSLEQLARDITQGPAVSSYLTVETKRRPTEGVDPNDLSQAGWGVIFAFGDRERLPALKDALGELLAHRRDQAGERYREFCEPDDYWPGDSKDDFLVRHGVGPGPVDPRKIPYYLLIVGDPEAIPYRFQYQLDVQHAVGRIHFETLEEYAQYARSVVTAETGRLALPRQITFFGVANRDDRATQTTDEQLMKPLAEAVSSGQQSWQVETVTPQSASKSRLRQLLGGEETPALLFTASHGMAFPNSDARQFPHQGALLCQDWPGPDDWDGPIPQDFYLAGDDIDDGARLLGLITFHAACYGAGTPRLDDFTDNPFDEPDTIAPQAFVARLPQRLLAHPKGGALAAVSHVDRLWGYSFAWGRAGNQTAVFESFLHRLLNGHRVGNAVDYFNERYAELGTILSERLRLVRLFRDTSNIDDLEIASLWTAYNDARSYVIVGDPAVRLPVADPGENPTARTGIAAIELSAISSDSGDAEGESTTEAGPDETDNTAAIISALHDLNDNVSLRITSLIEQSNQSQVQKRLGQLGDQLAAAIEGVADTLETEAVPGRGGNMTEDRLYFNGIDGETGEYLMESMTYEQASSYARGEPANTDEKKTLNKLSNDFNKPGHLGLPEGMSRKKLADAGWAVVFHKDENPEVKTALQKLRQHRLDEDVKDAARVKVLEYNGSDSANRWLAGLEVKRGTIHPWKVPYYLLLVGSPEKIPFHFSQLLATEYAVGRLHFNTPAGEPDIQAYERYVQSIIDYEKNSKVNNSKEAAFFATRHRWDRATNLAADLLVNPLLEGIPAGNGAPAFLPVACEAGFGNRPVLDEAATKQAFFDLLAPGNDAHSPAFLFASTHGMGFRKPLDDRQRQEAVQGALICQDWKKGQWKPKHYMTARELPDNSKLHGMIAFLFACYGCGTPAYDQFLYRPGQPPVEIAARPFIAALPKAMLSHDNGGALAVIGHVERAWSYSYALKRNSLIEPFRNAAIRIMKGRPVGYAMQEFGEMFAHLSADLTHLTKQRTFGADIDDEQFARFWSERNDAAGYAIIGDPAVRLNVEKLH
ncbi:MAG: hypothetical protein U9R25_18670 [Chloroflexota bacterium]|nr:hypothetical protein [Chloroflexota bacterium]